MNKVLKTIFPLRCIRCNSCRNNHIDAKLVLCKDNRDRTVDVLKSLKPLGKVTSKRRAAVLVPLCIHNNEIALVLTVRAMTLRNNRGQVAFPGGMEDTNDKTLLDTALRETKEEIGVNAANVDVWGPGPAVGRSDMTVTPYLGFVGDFDPKNLTVNHEEVEKVFTTTLSFMCNPKNFRTTRFRNGNNMVLPVFNTPEFRIWGLTAIIVHTMLLALLPQHYTNKVEHRILSSTSLPKVVFALVILSSNGLDVG